jgi:chemotaxis protein MotA
MTGGRATRFDGFAAAGAVMAVGVVLVGQLLEGGRVRSLLQPTAAVIVFGGTLAALLVSFPAATLKRTISDVWAAFFYQPPAMDALASELTRLALQSKRRGMMSLESYADETTDKFLGRALSLATDGLPSEGVRRAMETEIRVTEEADEEAARVLEAAAGYTPTLGILGAVLGLIHVMENLAAPSKLGAGIAVAFVATVYGVAAANLLFMPLAAKIRGAARSASVRREMTLEAVVAIMQGIHPRQLEEQLEAYAQAQRQRPRMERAA